MNIAEGIQILHCLNPPIIHRDIKLSTILINAFFNAKLADFGLAQALTSFIFNPLLEEKLKVCLAFVGRKTKEGT